MKTKNRKRLQLNRELLLTLEGGALAQAAGGSVNSGSQFCTMACQPPTHSAGQPTYCHCAYCPPTNAC